MKDINYFLTQLLKPSEASIFSSLDVLMAMLISTLLCFMIAHVYRKTHRGTSYSQSFLVTLFIMAVATSIVMMIIGSNIARAFSLVGALSIIRFRTAMKDPRDTGFLFLAMIAGMGCGTQFYLPAIMLVVFSCVLVLLLYHFDFGIKQSLESILHVTFQETDDACKSIEDQLGHSFTNYKRINRVIDVGDNYVTNVYVVRPNRKTDHKIVESGLKSIKEVIKISIYETDQHSPI